VQPLLEALDIYPSDFHLKILETLGELKDPGATERLVTLVYDQISSEGLRWAAVAALGKIGAVDGLAKVLATHKDEAVRCRAAEAFAIVRDRRAINPLVGALADRGSFVVDKANRALAIIDPSWARSQEAAMAAGRLRLALESSDDLVRAHAAEALVQIGDKQSVGALVAALKKAEFFSRRILVCGLSGILEPRHVEDVITALSSASADVRRGAAEVLGSVREPRVVKALIPLLDDKDVWVKHAAARALGKIGAPEAVTPLLELLRRPDAHARAAAAEALGEIRDPTAGDGLMEALQGLWGTEGWGARAAIAVAIGRLKDARGVELLAREARAGVKEAVNALAEIGVPAVSSLTDLLRQSENHVEAGRDALLRMLTEAGAAIPEADLTAIAELKAGYQAVYGWHDPKDGSPSLRVKVGTRTVDLSAVSDFAKRELARRHFPGPAGA